MTPAELTAIRERAEQATEGPWAAWYDQDGQPHMQGRLMVGNADAVIPDGKSWVEGVDINPVAECLIPEDREFIVHAREDIPALLDHVEVQASVIEALNAGVNNALSAKIHAVRELHKPIPNWNTPYCAECNQGLTTTSLLNEEGVPYHCPTITAVDGD